MNREAIIELARQASILEPTDLLESNQWRQDTIRELEHFAKLVAEHEREKCAKVCDAEVQMLTAIGEHRCSLAAGVCAATIRARSMTKGVLNDHATRNRKTT